MMTFETNFHDAFIFDKETNCIVAKISDLNLRSVDNTVTIKSIKTGKKVTFTFCGVDFTDSSKEDIAGWNFIANGPDVRLHLLIIND